MELRSMNTASYPLGSQAVVAAVEKRKLCRVASASALQTSRDDSNLGDPNLSQVARDFPAFFSGFARAILARAATRMMENFILEKVWGS
jgi:hypothetical protein